MALIALISLDNRQKKVSKVHSCFYGFVYIFIGTDYDEIPCDGWGPWASWSQCDLATDSRTRSRVCLNSHCDEGHDFERQTCDGLHTSPVSSGSSSDLVAVACICRYDNFFFFNSAVFKIHIWHNHLLI